MDYYYQIKGLLKDGNWSWPPIASGQITAGSTKEARQILESEYGVKLPGAKGKSDTVLLCTLIDMENKPYLRQRFDVRICTQCGKEYTLNEKYLLNAGGNREHCSSDCSLDERNTKGVEVYVNSELNGIHEAVIYKITNKKTGLCYIGKTTQAFTLRWYQHFYQSCGTKFHSAIKEYGLDCWTFEVIEIVGDRRTPVSIILERESFWIKHFNSINNGYNSVISKTEEITFPTLF